MSVWDDLTTIDSETRAGLEATFDDRRLSEYYDFLAENARFFSTADRERILERHLFEAAVAARSVVGRLGVSHETSIMDAGSGPGLPGMLFAGLRSAPPTTLVDSSRRRLGVVEEWARSRPGQWANAHFVYARLEELDQSFDVVVIRALVPFPFNLELVSAATRVGGHAVLLAGKRLEAQGRAAALIQKLGFVSRETLTPPEIQFLGERHIHILHKTMPTPRPYPRAWGIIKRELDSWGR